MILNCTTITRLSRFSLLLILSSLIAGCVTPPTAYIGRSVAELYAEKGPPDLVMDDPSCAGCKMHVYAKTNNYLIKSQNPQMADITLTGEERIVYYVNTQGFITRATRIER